MMATMMLPRASFSAVVTEDCGRIIVLGGYNGEALSNVEGYDFSQSQWSKLPPLPEPRYLHCSILVPDQS